MTIQVDIVKPGFGSGRVSKGKRLGSLFVPPLTENMERMSRPRRYSHSSTCSSAYGASHVGSDCGRLATAAAERYPYPEMARTFDQALIPTMVRCLTDTPGDMRAATGRHQAAIAQPRIWS